MRLRNWRFIYYPQTIDFWGVVNFNFGKNIYIKKQ